MLIKIEDQKQCWIKFMPSSNKIFLLSALYPCICKKKKKKNCFTGLQFSYSGCCMHVSHENENCQKKNLQEKKYFITVTLFPPQIMVEEPFFQKNSLFCKLHISHFCLLTVSHYRKHFHVIWLRRSFAPQKKHSRNILYQRCIHSAESTF